MADTARNQRVCDVLGRLTHDDPAQLLFPAQEIAGDLCYVQHGVRVDPGATVLDVGANIGMAAVWFATFCGAATVHCFEPAPPNLEMLRRNVAGLESCVVHPCGVGARAAEATVTWYAGAAAMAMASLYADPARDRATVRRVLENFGIEGEEADAQLAGRYEPERYSCEIRTLSEVIREYGIARVDLLKVDVERAEHDVLVGVETEHWPRIRQVVVEVHDEEGRLAAITAQLRSRGFVVAADQDATMRGTDVHLLYATRP